MSDLLIKLQKQMVIAAIGGSDFKKASRQLGPKRNVQQNSYLNFQVL